MFIVEDMMNSNMCFNLLSKNNNFIVDCQLNSLFTNHLWGQFKEKYDYSFSDYTVRNETDIGTRSIKHFK